MTAFGFALVGAFFTLPARNTWGERFENGVMSAVIALIFVFLVCWVWNLWVYRHSGRSHDNWLATAGMSGNAVVFWLVRKPDAMPVSFTEHGLMECLIRAPDGETCLLSDSLAPPRMLIGHGDSSVLALWEKTVPGVYDVWWYGSRKRGKYYEITRATFDLAPPPRVPARTTDG